jgi:uncharacterized membrane protein
MSHSIYLILHLIGLAMTVQAVGMAIVSASRSAANGADSSAKRSIAMFHGIGLFLLILGGFGMLARLAIPFPFPGWVWVKLLVWLTFGASTVMIRKRPETSAMWMVLAVVLVAIAAIMGVTKPF